MTRAHLSAPATAAAVVAASHLTKDSSGAPATALRHPADHYMWRYERPARATDDLGNRMASARVADACGFS